jgi:hypothetical protein
MLVGLSLLALNTGAATSTDISGTWKFEKAVDYDAPTRQVRAPSAPYAQIANGKLFIPPACIVELQRKPYYPGGPFQALLKEGADESAIKTFLRDQFALDLPAQAAYFEADAHDRSRCNRVGTSFLAAKDKFVGIFAGSNFFGYSRVVSNPAPAGDAPSILRGLKVSQLPFFPAGYSQLCPNLRPSKDGRLQNPEQCAPLYFPAVAIKDTDRPLASLLASHRYASGGARHAAADYDDPAAHRLHPVFFVLPPVGDVIVVRVEDYEGGGEVREPMSGVYLSIKNGKVVDQLNEGCGMDVQFICSSEDGRTRYQLESSGTFKRLE